MSLVVLSTGDRPEALSDALESARTQSGVEWVEIVVVWNGCDVQPTHESTVDIASPENVGIPEGRNLGAASSSGDVIVFLDDDARFTRSESIGRAVGCFSEEPRLGAISFRLVDDGGETSRRHVPRVGAKRPDVPGEVTQFLGGAVAIRREAFDDAGGYPGDFFYAMEESDLALGMIDAGWSIRYEPEIEVYHPRSEPARHAGHVHRTARNRVLLARRRLPWVIGAIYVLDWLILTTVRERARWASLKALVQGTTDGLRAEADRSPIRWRTIWRLARLGRPPII